MQNKSDECLCKMCNTQATTDMILVCKFHNKLYLRGKLMFIILIRKPYKNDYQMDIFWANEWMYGENACKICGVLVFLLPTDAK